MDKLLSALISSLHALPVRLGPTLTTIGALLLPHASARVRVRVFVDVDGPGPVDPSFSIEQSGTVSTTGIDLDGDWRVSGSLSGGTVPPRA